MVQCVEDGKVWGSCRRDPGQITFSLASDRTCSSGLEINWSVCCFKRKFHFPSRKSRKRSFVFTLELNVIGSHRLSHLDTPSPVGGTVWRELGGIALLEAGHCWRPACVFETSTYLLFSSLLHTCVWRILPPWLPPKWTLSLRVSPLTTKALQLACINPTMNGEYLEFSPLA